MFRAACDNSVTTSQPAGPPTANPSMSKCSPACPVCNQTGPRQPSPLPHHPAVRLTTTHHDSFHPAPPCGTGRVIPLRQFATPEVAARTISPRPRLGPTPFHRPMPDVSTHPQDVGRRPRQPVRSILTGRRMCYLPRRSACVVECGLEARGYGTSRDFEPSLFEAMRAFLSLTSTGSGMGSSRTTRPPVIHSVRGCLKTVRFGRVAWSWS